jgi:DNA-binding winged helix-turn-helix (wHTH) protein/pimeloyl-ACP methyl ester carboxylesterase
MKFRFADCVLDDAAYTLTRGGAAQDIEPQVFDFLHFLVQNPGTLVTRDQMIQAVWNGRIVSESAISARISALRRAVGDDGKRQAVIRTLPRRGIQLVAPVSRDTPAQPPHSAPQQTAQQTAQPAAQTIRFATADDGIKIAYAASGAGAPLLRVAHHPAHLELEWAEPTDRATFDNIGSYRTLIRMDQRGSGLSDLDIDDFSAARSAADIAAVADAAGLERFALLGTSSGAMVAVEFAARYPDRLTHLVLQAGYVDGRALRDDTRDDAIATMARAGWDTPDSAFVMGYLSVYFPTASKEQIKRFARTIQNACPMENEVRGREFFNNHSVAPLLARVRTPTLVLHSREDVVHPLSEAQKLARGIDGAQFVVLESRNHYVLPEEDSWQTLTQSIRTFLQG